MRYSAVVMALAVLICSFQIGHAKIIHVPADSSTIQGGINGAVDGDTVLVATGHYYERISFYGKGILVTSNFIFDNDTTTIDSTIIDADTLVLGVTDKGSVVTFPWDSDSTSVINGFTLQNGIGTLGFRGRYGGGIYCIIYSSPKISNNRITHNSADFGGGICCYYSGPLIINNLISYNSDGGILCWGTEGAGVIKNNIITFNSGYIGGGVSCYHHSSPLINNNTIANNYASGEGGGISCTDHSSPLIKSNTISNNYAVYYGGGLSCWQSSPTINNNRMAGNSARGGGAIFCSIDCMAYILGNVIAGNSASSGGGGIDCDWNASPVITNNIICNSPVGEGIHSIDEAWPTVSFNDLWNNADGDFIGGQPGVGDTTWGKNFNHTPCDSFYNIIRDPMFADTVSYALLCSSACIDAGDSTFEVPDSGGRRIDMGFYEYPYVMGDTNQDGEATISDLVHLINYIFLRGPCPCPRGKGDVNCNGYVDISGAVYLANYLFRNGPEPGCF